MSKILRIKYFFIIALSVLLISAHISVANEAFKNSLIRMDFAKTSGGIQVKLYTNKPYDESVSTVKKSDSEYVILMPETSNSMTATPVLNPVSDIVRAVSVKTQQYENGAKGYTKITVSTSKPIEVVTQVKAINATNYQLSEDDYSELMQAAKKPKTVIAQKPAAKPVAKIAQKPAEIKTQAKLDLTKSRVGFSPPKQKVGYPLNTPAPKKIKAEFKPKIIAKSQIAQKPVSQPVKITKPVQEVKPVQETTVPSPSPTAQPKQNALSAPAPTVQTPIKPTPELTLAQKLINVAKNPKLLLKYKGFVEKNIYIIAGVALLLFLILLLGARKMTKGLKKQKEAFAKNLNESPAVTTDFMNKINENMTWKEKYQTYMDATNQPQQQNEPKIQPSQSEPEILPFEASQELNELFETNQEDNFEQKTATSEPIINEEDFDQYVQQHDIIAETDIPQHEISSSEDSFGKDKLDELFGADEDVFGEEGGFISEDFSFNETSAENIISSASFYETPIAETMEAGIAEQKEDVEEIKEEYIIDSKRGFYLVDYKDSSALVGHIEDEVFILKQFKEKIEGTLQARLDEHKGTSANYMTRIGKFKALVEVKPDNMNLLIEL